MQHRQQHLHDPLAFGPSKSAANAGASSKRGRLRDAASTFSPCTHSSVTPSRSCHALRASASASVVGCSRPANFISFAACFKLSLHFATPGTYLSFDSACVLISTDAAMYFFSTHMVAAGAGFSRTHIAPLNKARVTLAAAAGSRRNRAPLTTETQQNSSA